MTATQAPTPGPLSMTIGQIDLERLRSIIHLATHQVLPFADKPMQPFSAKERAGMQVEIADLIINDIGKANAPTAPVEASGSERDTSDAIDLLVRSKAALQGHIDAIQAGKQASEIGQPVGQPNPILECINGLPEIVRWLDAGQFDIEAAFEDYEDRIDAALRPQPSGETREQAVMVCPQCEGEGHYADGVDEAACSEQCTRCAGNGWIVDLALLSSRPLALGGQQGDSETLRVLLDNLVIAQTLSKDIRQKATDEACSYLYDRRTTPARAEAQDEGAAGDSAIALARRCTQTIAAQHGPDSDFANGARMVLAALICAPALDHPSPPPAADADRVRIAVEAFLKAEDEARDRLREAGTPLPSTPEVDALREALAALKSTAAKEGGEL